MNNLKQTAVASLVGALVGLVVLLVGSVLVGNNQSADLGAPITANSVTRFPNSGLAARFLYITSGAMPTTAQTDGSAYFGGNVTATGTVRISPLTLVNQSGSIPLVVDSVVTSTQSLTSSQVCNNSMINMGFGSATGTLTLGGPASSTCLSTLGDTHTFLLRNASSSGGFLLANGASSSISTLSLSSLTTSSLGFATSTVSAQQIAKVTGTLISSSSQNWVMWLVEVFSK